MKVSQIKDANIPNIRSKNTRASILSSLKKSDHKVRLTKIKTFEMPQKIGWWGLKI